MLRFVRRFLPSHNTLFILAWVLALLGVIAALDHYRKPCETSDTDPSLTTCSAPWE